MKKSSKAPKKKVAKSTTIAPSTKVPRVATKHDELLVKLRSLKEDDLSKRILKPLFVALGFEKVEFHGGAGEEGKDLICHGTDRYDQTEITVIQVKKYNDSLV